MTHKGLALTRRTLLTATAGTLAAPTILRAAPLKKVTLVIQFFARGDYAQYYLALERGYYAERGLDVTIKHVLGNALAYQMISAGNAQFAHADIVQMLQLQGTNPDPQMRLVAAIADKLALSLFYIKGRGISVPKDLEGRKIVDSPGSTAPFIFKMFAQKTGIDTSKVTWINAAATAKVAVMVQGGADAVAIYLPARASISAGLPAGEELGAFTFGDYVDIYGDGLIALDRFVQQDPEATKAFVQASVRGCRDAFADPEAAVDAMRKHFPEVNRANAIKEEQAMAEVALTPRQKQHGIGWIDPAKMQATYDAVVQQLGQPIAKPVTAFYTPDLL